VRKSVGLISPRSIRRRYGVRLLRWWPFRFRGSGWRSDGEPARRYAGFLWARVALPENRCAVPLEYNTTCPRDGGCAPGFRREFAAILSLDPPRFG